MSKRLSVPSNYPSMDRFIKRTKIENFKTNKINSQLRTISKNIEATAAPEATAIAKLTTTTAATATTKTTTTAANILENKYKICERNLKIAKKLLKKTSEVNLQKDIKIRELTKNEKLSVISDDLFEKFKNHFNSKDILKIRSVGPGLKKDSTFVHRIMKALYRDDVDKLKNRSATGKKFKGNKKMEITFEKKNILNMFLIERVKSELSDQFGTSKEYLKRIGRLNTLVRFAIGNLSSKTQKQSAISTQAISQVQSYQVSTACSYKKFHCNGSKQFEINFP